VCLGSAATRLELRLHVGGADAELGARHVVQAPARRVDGVVPARLRSHSLRAVCCTLHAARCTLEMHVACRQLHARSLRCTLRAGYADATGRMQPASYRYCMGIFCSEHPGVLIGYSQGNPGYSPGYSPGVPKRGVRRGRYCMSSATYSSRRDDTLQSARTASVPSRARTHSSACRRTGAGACGPVPYSRSGRARGSSGRGLHSRSLRAHRRRRSPPHTRAALPTANGCARACACVCVRVCLRARAALSWRALG
jgi:hypothetical protein